MWCVKTCCEVSGTEVVLIQQVAVPHHTTTCPNFTEMKLEVARTENQCRKNVKPIVQVPAQETKPMAVDAGGLEDGADSTIPSTVTTPQETSRTTDYSVEIDRTYGGAHGFDFDVLDESRCTITAIKKGGHFCVWNSKCSRDKTIKPMDLLVSVNGVSGTVDRLMEMLEARLHLKICFKRPVAYEVPVTKTGRPLGISLGVDDSSKGILIIDVLEDGLVADWNRANRSKQIRISDRIVAVSGLEDTGRNLLNVIKASSHFDLKILSWTG